MNRIVLAAAAGFTFIAAAALGATDVLDRDTHEVIEIDVTADELAECRETLAQVASMPAVHDNGTPVLFNWGQSDLPEVRCVVSEV